MKRSEINNAVLWAQDLVKKRSFFLPPFGYRAPEGWKTAENEESVKRLMLGWDVTDFGSGNFASVGAVLFTLRNGTLSGEGTPYAEKLLMFAPGQFIPFHYHIQKTEDIINRGGGILNVTLFNADRSKAPDNNKYPADEKSDVVFYTDGKRNTLPAGGTIDIQPGASITLRPYVYHKLGAKKGRGDLLAGEVSSVNDDLTDNVFLTSLPRFTKIEEDEERKFILCNEYNTI
jgi:D-lyxose ketol-isomerase